MCNIIEMGLLFNLHTSPLASPGLVISVLRFVFFSVDHVLISVVKFNVTLKFLKGAFAGDGYVGDFYYRSVERPAQLDVDPNSLMMNKKWRKISWRTHVSFNTKNEVSKINEHRQI